MVNSYGSLVIETCRDWGRKTQPVRIPGIQKGRYHPFVLYRDQTVRHLPLFDKPSTAQRDQAVLRSTLPYILDKYVPLNKLLSYVKSYKISHNLQVTLKIVWIWKTLFNLISGKTFCQLCVAFSYTVSPSAGLSMRTQLNASRPPLKYLLYSFFRTLSINPSFLVIIPIFMNLSLILSKYSSSKKKEVTSKAIISDLQNHPLLLTI